MAMGVASMLELPLRNICPLGRVPGSVDSGEVDVCACEMPTGCWGWGGCDPTAADVRIRDGVMRRRRGV